METAALFGQIATGIAAIAGLILAIVTIVERARADRREHWWKRAQWALDLTLSENLDKQSMGLRALTYLGKSKLTRKDEAQLIGAAWEALLDTDEANTVLVSSEQGVEE
ncbi:MAG: hypothetical protein FWG25_09975 [Promicromonosporaceae bacterium]|nr:hypothetical protein [Promicromonosporaceae bacterium]